MGLDMYIYRRPIIREAIPEEVRLEYEEVAYFSKAYALDDWLQKNCEKEFSDVGEYCGHMKKSTVKALYQDCLKVLKTGNHFDMIPDRIPTNEFICVDGEYERKYENGLVMSDPTVARKLIPAPGGIYDERYIVDIRRMREVCMDLLENTKFSKQEVVYFAWW